MIRVLAWPRSPNRMMSCPARTAFSSWGRTVSSKPSTPVTSGSPAAIRADALRRISSATLTGAQPAWRRAPSVVMSGGGVRRAERSTRAPASRCGGRAPGWSWGRAYACRSPTWCGDSHRPGHGGGRAARGHPEVVVSHRVAQGWNDNGLSARRPPGPARVGARSAPPTTDGPERPHTLAGHGLMREMSIDDVGGRIRPPHPGRTRWGTGRAGRRHPAHRPLLGPTGRHLRGAHRRSWPTPAGPPS